MKIRTFIFYALRDLIIATLFMTIAATVLSESKQFSSVLHIYYAEVTMLVLSLIALGLDVWIKGETLLNPNRRTNTNSCSSTSND